MKVAKVLKLKNQVAGEIALLKERLAEQNVRPEGRPFDYDNQEVLKELRSKMDELVRVKTSLATANSHVYADIFRLAELKGLLCTLRSIETKQGLYREGHSFAGETTKVEYRSQLGKAELDRLATEVELEINALQDRLDEFNATHEVALAG